LISEAIAHFILSASWEKQRARPAPLTAADVREKVPSDASLACPICGKLLRDAVKTPCCSKTFDEECIQTHLLESDFVCPSCHSKVPSLDKVTPDNVARDRVRRHIEEEIAKSVAPVDLKTNTPESEPQTAAQARPVTFLWSFTEFFTVIT
jgi:protein MPE1